eukprot:TCALIF_13440-PA protein Name:"Similar to GluClalpha Glutamate-gated chloride channel (Drosophila melanogaster)" AED:0.27 eAED:0.33 QI:0/0.42/0.12/0.62/1/1/8/0/517
MPGHQNNLDPSLPRPPIGNGAFPGRDLPPDGVRPTSWKWWRYHDLSDKEILDHLVHGQRYDKRELPPSVGPLLINTSLTVISLDLQRYSDIHPRLSISLEFRQSWFDPRLIHVGNQRYSYLNGINHLNSLWIPQLYFQKMTQGSNWVENGSKHSLKIFVNGSVWMSTRMDGHLECQSSSVVQFPFDKIHCFMSAESVSHSTKDIMWQWKRKGRFIGSELRAQTGDPDESPSRLNHNFQSLTIEDCLALRTEYFGRANHSCLQAKFVFNRNLSDFFLTVFFPDFVLVSWALMTFWIDLQTSCLLRTVLAFVTFFNCFLTSKHEDQGFIHEITAVETWHLITFLMISGTCFQLVIIQYLGRKRTRLRTKQKETFAFQNELQRYEAQAGSSCRLSSTLSHTHHHHHHHNNQTPNLASSSLIQVESQCCQKCSASSPFRATDLSMAESLEDARSISSGIFEKKLFREDLGSTSNEAVKAYRHRPSSVRDLTFVRRLDRMSRVLFPSVYIFLVMTYLCKYLD